jgi:hypothetical protein
LRFVFNSNFELSDSIIGEICGLSLSTIWKWWKKFNIKGREFEYRSINLEGYIVLLMPPEYRPPYINYLEHGRVKRMEHIVIMENYLKKYPKLSKLYLIDGKYLKPECEVHHKNSCRSDNRIENLWVYKNSSEHSLSKQSLSNSLSELIKLGQIYLDMGKYYLRDDFDLRMLDRFYIEQMIRPVEFIDFQDLDKVRDVLKDIDWYEVSDTWTVEYKPFGSRHQIRSLVLDPYSECSSENPLYMHKRWVERVVNDKRFNITDSRLAKLCNISEMTAYRWRWERHRISKKNH